MSNSKQSVRPRGTDEARVVSVIETKSLLGHGTESDPCRHLVQYWDFKGNLLAQADPCVDKDTRFSERE